MKSKITSSRGMPEPISFIKFDQIILVAVLSEKFRCVCSVEMFKTLKDHLMS